MCKHGLCQWPFKFINAKEYNQNNILLGIPYRETCRQFFERRSLTSSMALVAQRYQSKVKNICSLKLNIKFNLLMHRENVGSNAKPIFLLWLKFIVKGCK